MSKVITYELGGTVQVVIPAPKAQYPGESEADFLARIAAGAVPAGVPHKIIEGDDLPTRRFRDAWVCNDTGVEVNMPVARAVKMKRIRAEREHKFTTLDNKIRKAQDVGDDTAPLRQKRKQLRSLPRDIRNDLDGISDPDNLDAYQPAIFTDPDLQE